MKHLYLIVLLCFSAALYGQAGTVASEKEIEGFKLYPNPVTQGKVYIETKTNSPKTVFIYDLFGTKRLEKRLTGVLLELPQLIPGVYVIRVIQNDKVATRKLIIK